MNKTAGIRVRDDMPLADSRPIASALDQLQKTRFELGEQLDILLMSIQPILARDMRDEAKSDHGEAESIDSVVFESIVAETEGLRSLISRVAEARSRVQL